MIPLTLRAFTMAAVVLVSTLSAQPPAATVAPASQPCHVNDAQTYFEFQVEKPVRVAPGSPVPVYPPELKAAGIKGKVLVSFVVDTLGRSEPGSFKLLEANDGRFVPPVRAALRDMRFLPAELCGHKVRQLAMQPFIFDVSP